VTALGDWENFYVIVGSSAGRRKPGEEKIETLSQLKTPNAQRPTSNI
jgi:hypothetical protein